MAHWLEKYRDSEIEIIYLGDTGFRDRGTLADLGDDWIELHKRAPNADVLLIPTTAIRFARPLDARLRQEQRLLRPVAEPPEVIEVHEDPS